MIINHNQFPVPRVLPVLPGRVLASSLQPLSFLVSPSAFSPHFSFLLSAFQLFAGPTLNPQLLCRDCTSRARCGNRLLLQRAATATLWDREAGTRVSKVSTPPAQPHLCPSPGQQRGVGPGAGQTGNEAGRRPATLSYFVILCIDGIQTACIYYTQGLRLLKVVSMTSRREPLR
jgi:hypothetical protein